MKEWFTKHLSLILALLMVFSVFGATWFLARQDLEAEKRIIVEIKEKNENCEVILWADAEKVGVARMPKSKCEIYLTKDEPRQ